MKSYIIKNKYLLLILFAGLLIRLIGIIPGYTLSHPDEAAATYYTALEMITHNDFNPRRYDYPATIALFHNILYRLFIIPLRLAVILPVNPKLLTEAIKNNVTFFKRNSTLLFGSDLQWIYYFSRYVNAIVGAGVVWLAYLLGKKMFNKRVGLIAAFLIAFNYRHVLSSHLALLDVNNSFFVLLSFIANINLLKKDSRRNYWLAGFAAGLCFSVKYQFFHFTAFALVHLLWAFKRKSFRIFWRKELFEAVVIGILTFAVTNPYYILNLRRAIEVAKWDAKRYAFGREKFMTYPLFYLYHWGIGRALFGLIILGVLISLFTDPINTLLVLSFVLPYFYVMVYYSGGGGWVRNFTVVIPLLLLFAATILEKIRQMLRHLLGKTKVISISFFLAVLLINLPSIVNSATASLSYAQPWNLTRLERWLFQNLPSGVKLRSYPIPSSFITNGLFKKLGIGYVDWSYGSGASSVAEFQSEGTDFAIMGKGVQAMTYWWYVWSDHRRFLKMNDIPYDFIESSFIGLSFRELRDYTVAEFFKPWQAYDESIVIFKIPEQTKELGKKIAGYSFDSLADFWQVTGTFDFTPPKMSWTKNEGKFKKGALLIDEGYGTPTAKLSSLPIGVKPNKLYTVSGWIKIIPLKDSSKDVTDGFLRLDLFNRRPLADLDKPGDKVALSSRVFVSNQWQKVRASLISADELKWLTVSFQVNGSARNYQVFVDDIEVFENDLTSPEKFPQIPYIKSTIPLNSIYRNQFL